MRIAVSILCAFLLAITSTSAQKKQACHDAARAFIVPLILGHYQELGPVGYEPPGGWEEWVAAKFPAPGGFNAYSIREPVIGNGVCRIGLRLKKANGSTYVLFAEFDSNRHLTGLRTTQDAFEERRQQVAATLAEIKKILPGLRTGTVDDVAILPLLRQLSATAKQTRSDVIDFAAILEDPTPR